MFIRSLMLLDNQNILVFLMMLSLLSLIAFKKFHIALVLGVLHPTKLLYLPSSLYVLHCLFNFHFASQLTKALHYSIILEPTCVFQDLKTKKWEFCALVLHFLLFQLIGFEPNFVVGILTSLGGNFGSGKSWLERV